MYSSLSVLLCYCPLLLLLLVPISECFSWSSSSNHLNINNHRQLYLLKAAASSTSSSSHVAKDNDITARQERLQTLANLANNALDEHGSEILKTFNARVGVIDPSDNKNDDFQSNYLRLGLISTQSYSKGDQLIATLPYYENDGTSLCISSNMATKIVYKDVLPEGYDGWTGDVGLLAMILLNEMARSCCSNNKNNNNAHKGIGLPKRSKPVQSLLSTWISTLPSYNEMSNLHPLLWNEDDQETLQNSSTKKIYRLLDDIEDDSSWLDENLWSKDRDAFPESVTISIIGDDGVEEEQQQQRPCFTPEGFKYAISIVRSRSFYVDGSLRLLPYLDYANHDDYDTNEILGGGIGTLWGSEKGALLKSGKPLNVGDEIRISYGPKGPADYLLDHGFVPNMCQLNGSGGRSGPPLAITAELSFEIDDTDRFRDDKLDVLEYETYDLAPMEPLQTFDVTGGPGSTGEPDPAMIQFLRLVKLGGKDAFLLESIFRKEIWEFMSEPVSEDNERGAITAVIEACELALSEMEEGDGEEQQGDDDDGISEKNQLCKMVRESEREALDRTLVYVKQDAMALDLKEYYQERRLKGLGLDSEWSPEDDYGVGRVPGGADYDW